MGYFLVDIKGEQNYQRGNILTIWKKNYVRGASMAKAPSFFILIVWSFFQCLYIQIFLHFLMAWLQALFLGWQVAFTKVYCAFCKSVFSRERVKTCFFVREIKLNPLRKTVFKNPSLNRVKQKIEEILKILATLHASDTYFFKRNWARTYNQSKHSEATL